jgi:tetratricopeptide (TPR) repeat protein
VGADQQAAADIFLRAADCCRKIGNPRGQALALSQSAHALTFLGSDEIARGRELLQTAGEVAKRDPDPRIDDLLESGVAINHFASGDIDKAEAMLRDIYADTTRTDLLSSFALSYLADCAIMVGRYEQALGRFAAFVREIRGTDTHNVLLQCVGIVVALSGLGRDAEAVELHTAIGATMPPHSEILLGPDLYPGASDLLESARERLGPRAVADAEQRGASRTIEDIEAWVVSMAPARVPV